MKKVKLKALEAGAKELLSREQLKNVFGGSTSGICLADGCQVTIWGTTDLVTSASCMGVETGDGSLCGCGGEAWTFPTYFDTCTAYNTI